jgi:hypothetical protein
MKFHRPQPYRYPVALPVERRAVLNRYGRHVIGVAVVVGARAYCLKWARV